MVGKQINFYFTPKDESLFITEMNKHGDMLATDKNIQIKIQNSEYLNSNSHSQVWIESPKSRVYFTKHGFIERNQSEVIEYLRSTSLSFFTPRKYSIPSFDEYVTRSKKEIVKGAKVYHKGKFIKPSEISLEDLKEKYDSLLKERKEPDKNVLSSGRLWAAMKYVENHQWAEKEKWFKDWYDSYVKWIKDYCKLSKDRNFYIGDDAYKVYKKGTFILQALGGFQPEWE